MDRLRWRSYVTRPLKGLAPLLRGRDRAISPRAALFTAVALAALIALGLFYVWTRMKVIQLGYEIAELEKKNTGLKNRKRELLVEMTALQSPSELEKRARNEAGLIFPPMGKVVHVP